MDSDNQIAILERKLALAEGKLAAYRELMRSIICRVEELGELCWKEPLLWLRRALRDE